MLQCSPACISDAEEALQGTLLLCCAAETTPPPVQALGPHVAALGVKFYHVPTVKGIPPNSWFPSGFNSTGTVFIAEHGSWNRQALGETQ